MEEEKKKIKLFGATIGEVVAVAPKEEESPEIINKEEESPEIIKEGESCEIKTTNEEERSKNKEEESCKIIKNNEAMIVVQKECSNKDDRSNDSSCGSSITFTLLGKRQCGIYINDQPNQEGENTTPSKRAKKQNNPKPSKEVVSRAKIPPPKLPDEFRQKIAEMDGLAEPKLVTQKFVYAGDVKKDQSRFYIDGKEIKKEDFFSDEEKEKLKKTGEFQVSVILQRKDDKEIEDVKLWLTKWPKPKNSKGSNNNVETEEKPTSSEGSNNVEIKEEPKSSKGCNVETKEKTSFVLQRSWWKEKEKTDIKEGDVAQLWCFRYGKERKLGFAVLKINNDEPSTSASISITRSLEE